MKFINHNIYWILSIFLLGCLFIGHLQQNQPGNEIIDMSNKCQLSYSINSKTEKVNKGGSFTEHNKKVADACGKAIDKVQQGNHWEVLSNGQGNFWAEYKG